MAAQKDKKFLLSDPGGCWVIEPLYEAATPEEAILAFEGSEGGDGSDLANEYRVYEVVGEPVDIRTVLTLERV